MKLFTSLVFFLISVTCFGQQYYNGAASPNYKSPVTSAAALPMVGNSVGDVRVETTTFAMYVWNGVAWTLIANGGGGGTVTSVGLSLTGPLFTVSGSPVAGAGTLTGTINTQANNKVFAGPNGGGPLAPTFRSLVGADLPAPTAVSLGGVESYSAVLHQFLNAISVAGAPSSAQPDFTDLTGNATIAQGGTGQVTKTAGFDALSPLSTKGDLLGFNAVNNVRFPVGANGTVLSADSAQASGLAWIPAGTLTSVAQSVPVEFAIAGSPITTNGTLAITKVNETANTVWAGPTVGIPAQPTFRSLVSADIPSLSAIYLPLSGGSMSGAIDLGGNPINNMSDPTLTQDAATKHYVDSIVNGLIWKLASQECTTAALPANAYANGAAGVGATLTEVGFGALTVDGTAVTLGDRVLVKNEAAPANNGIYVVSATGGAGASYVLTRATDFNQSSNISVGATTLCINGTANADTAWSMTTSGAIVVGTTALSFSQVAGPGTLAAGTGLSIIGNVVSLLSPVSVANGGTNSTIALANNRVMQSSGGAVIEAAAITANRALISDANGIPVASATTNAELGYVSGVTSALQAQLNAKQATLSTSAAPANQFGTGFTAPNTFTYAQPDFSNLTGNATILQGGTNSTAALNNNRVMQSSGGAIVEAAAITANRALVSNGSGIPVASATTATELGYVSGVTSAIQTQINALSASSTQLKVLTKVANYTMLVSDNVVLADATGGAFIVTLPSAAASFAAGKSIVLTIKKIDSSANAVTVASGADLIDGLANQLLSSQYNSMDLVTDGVTWNVK